jgi:hypothetical protein
MRYKAEILSVICQRNAKRRQAQLPFLHVRAGYEAEITADREDDFEFKVQAVLTDAIERSLTLKRVARWQRQHKTNRWPRGMGILALLHGNAPMSPAISKRISIIEECKRSRWGLPRRPCPREVAMRCGWPVPGSGNVGRSEGN